MSDTPQFWLVSIGEYSDRYWTLYVLPADFDIAAACRGYYDLLFADGDPKRTARETRFVAFLRARYGAREAQPGEDVARYMGEVIAPMFVAANPAGAPGPYRSTWEAYGEPWETLGIDMYAISPRLP